MKKLVLTLLTFFLLSLQVNALPDTPCRPNELTKGRTDLLNVAFNLRYAEDAIDMNGEFLESQYYLTIPNLPSGYIALIENADGISYIGNSSEFAIVTGGVSTIEYYSTECNTLIKKTQFMAPFYKVYCEIEDNCKEDVWFDGTYENKPSNLNRRDNGVNMRLVVILIILIVIIVTIVVLIIKRRKSYEAGL